MATPTLKNAAVFHAGSRRFRNIDVEITDTHVNVLNNISGDVITSYEIFDVAKPGEAWDAFEVGQPDKHPKRLVVQLGCGCQGQRPYEETPEYKSRAIARATVA